MKIADLKVIYICPDHNEKYHARKLHMDSMLSRIGFTNVTHFKSTADEYPRCLSKAVISILMENLDTPVLVLEDDVMFKDVYEFDYVEDADAIYFGLSKCAGHPTENKDNGTLVVEPYSMTQVRVKNMLGGHAILYNSRKYKEAVISLLTANMEHVLEMDILFSRIQSSAKILALMKPAFYQSALLNLGTFVERLTNFEMAYMIGYRIKDPAEEKLG